MKPLNSLQGLAPLLGVLFTSLVMTQAYAGQAEDAAGKAALDDIRKRYNDVRSDCGSSSKPAFLCSGLIFRGGQGETKTWKFWQLSPRSKVSGGVSFSYLRKDSDYSKLAFNYKTGYITYPILGTPVPNKIDLDVLCFFPIDAATDARDSKGCGAHKNFKSVSGACELQNIASAQQWYSKYRADGDNRDKQCGFNVSDGQDAKATAAFNAGIESMKLAAHTSMKQQNEMRIATWDDSKPEQLPVQAIFYLDGGIKGARKDQKDYFDATKTFVPILHMKLPKDNTEEAEFSYSSTDQAVGGTSGCAQYFDSGSWVHRHDPGTGKNEWTLALKPSNCARNLDSKDSAQMDAAYAELVQKFGKDPEWVKNDKGGMSPQMVCHVAIAPNKQLWNLEPFRPATTNDESIAARCNHLTATVGTGAAPAGGGKCSIYFKNGYWRQRHDDFTGKDEWTLTVEPTDCGRRIQDDQTDAAYAEMKAKFAQDPQWQNNDGGGMRRQFVCYITSQRDKHHWNLEPFRPDVSYSEAKAANCNPVPSKPVAAGGDSNADGSCQTYISDTSYWRERYDSGTKKKEWTLSVYPTQCGRNIREEHTNAAFSELKRKYGNDPQWTSNGGNGMRRQFVCYLIKHRNDTRWNLEPFRPDVSNREALDSDCNPI